jgi:hypothetical protein
VQLEHTFQANYDRLLATDWRGEGREGTVEQAAHDLVKIRSPVYDLLDGASFARTGYDQQNGGKEWALDAVADAEDAGFAPNEDLSVTDTRTGGSAAQRAARQAEGQALSAQIRHRAALLVASNQEIATKLNTIAANLAGFSFDQPIGTSPDDTGPLPLNNPGDLWDPSTAHKLFNSLNECEGWILARQLLYPWEKWECHVAGPGGVAGLWPTTTA